MQKVVQRLVPGLKRVLFKYFMDQCVNVSVPHLYWTLKVIPSGPSSATWCYMANVSMLCLPTGVQKEWCLRFHYRNDKESHTFQRQKPLILQHDVDTDVSLAYLFNKSTHSFVVLINYL